MAGYSFVPVPDDYNRSITPSAGLAGINRNARRWRIPGSRGGDLPDYLVDYAGIRIEVEITSQGEVLEAAPVNLREALELYCEDTSRTDVPAPASLRRSRRRFVPYEESPDPTGPWLTPSCAEGSRP